MDAERDEACNQADVASEKAAKAEQATRACTTKLEDVTRAAKKAREEVKRRRKLQCMITGLAALF